MSAIDDYLHWSAPINPRGTAYIGKMPPPFSRDEAIADLAALRRERDDARLIARAAHRGDITPDNRRWFSWIAGFDDYIPVDRHGLPILTDAARAALEKELA